MRICPDCARAISESLPPGCHACGWQGELREGIPFYLGRRDREDPVLSDYFDNYEKIAGRDLNESIQDERYIKNQAENLIRIMGPLAGKRIADVGSGKGFVVRALLAAGADGVTAVDIAASYLRTYSGLPGVTALGANAENLPFADEFDCVAATDVMEHVLNVSSFLFSVNRALKKGGRFFVRVPYRENLLNYTPHLGCPYRFVHLRSFDETVLADLLSGVGFRVEKIVKDGFLPDSPRDFWRKTARRSRFYDRLVRPALEKGLSDPTSTAGWPGWLAAPLFRPLEICAEATKIRSFRRRSDGVVEGY